jgi:hypothetical protein
VPLWVSVAESLPSNRLSCSILSPKSGNRMALEPEERARIALEVWQKAVDDATGGLKLYFGLSTGAVVLFVNLLARVELSRVVLAPLAASILCFGFAAAWCLRVLMALSRVRIIMVQAILSQNETAESIQKRVKDWEKKAQKPAKWMERLFWAGMAFAAIFVVAVLVAR